MPPARWKPNVMPKTRRLDQLLLDRGLVDSREKARRLIMAGQVRVPDRPTIKPGDKVPLETAIEVLTPPKYVGRGGLKLEGALEQFGITVEGWTCLDVGASTGGFTDCLLQRGATRVFALDVGHDQLAWKIRNDPRVVVIEGFNARQLVPATLGETPIDLAVADVSFISLTLLLQPMASVLKAGGTVVVLIKPQFELGPQEVGKGGIVRETALHQKAIQKIEQMVSEMLPELEWRGCIPSPITGTNGNQEFLAWMTHRSDS